MEETIFIFKNKTNMHKGMDVMDRAWGGKPPGYSLTEGWNGRIAKIFRKRNSRDIARIRRVFKNNNVQYHIVF